MNSAPEDQRPTPDELLRRAELEEAKSGKGKLKIFFGACAGVGKTYAMLSAVRQLRVQGLDIVVGVIETHGRAETAALLEGLEILSPKEIAYRGTAFKEFDLDAALKRQPSIILVDELAHSNVAGSRHPKRWQDDASTALFRSRQHHDAVFVGRSVRRLPVWPGTGRASRRPQRRLLRLLPRAAPLHLSGQ